MDVEIVKIQRLCCSECGRFDCELLKSIFKEEDTHPHFVFVRRLTASPFDVIDIPLGRTLGFYERF